SVSSHDTGFFKNSETRYRSFCVLTIALGLTPIAPQASRKACSFLSVNSFIMYLPGVRTPFRSFLLIRTISRPLGRFRPPGTSIGVDLTLGHLKQLSREPRRIEILGQEKIAHFSPFCIFRVIFKLGKRLVFHRRRGFECGSYQRIESLGHWL